MKKIITSTILVLLGGSAIPGYAAKDFLNVSYDPTREFYQEYNELETENRASGQL